MNIDELYLDFLYRIVDRTVGENDALVLQIAMAKHNLELHEESVRASISHFAWAVTAQERNASALERIAKALEIAAGAYEH